MDVLPRKSSILSLTLLSKATTAPIRQFCVALGHPLRPGATVPMSRLKLHQIIVAWSMNILQILQAEACDLNEDAIMMRMGTF